MIESNNYGVDVICRRIRYIDWKLTYNKKNQLVSWSCDKEQLSQRQGIVENKYWVTITFIKKYFTTVKVTNYE